MLKQIFLWVLSIVMAFSAMIYQRSTGPTYEFTGNLEQDGTEYKYELIRSQETTEGAKIELPVIENVNYDAILHFKRYQTEDQIISIDFNLDDGRFIAQLPMQPAAGKMEYFITGSIEGKDFQIPAQGEESIVLRYKDPVSNSILIPHVLLMVLVIIFGIRAGLSALFDHGTMRRWVVVAVTGMIIGGMIFGPLVQKSAFGEYWTGFPFGSDFTDNKTLIMLVAWVLALAVIGFKPKRNEKLSRAVVLFAAVVMTVVYLIPHSMGGSTLDYDKIDMGIDPTEAVKTGGD